MTQPDTPRAPVEPLTVECPEPYCRAAIGRPCPIPASVPAHAARVLLAARAERDRDAVAEDAAFLRELVAEARVRDDLAVRVNVNVLERFLAATPTEQPRDDGGLERWRYSYRQTPEQVQSTWRGSMESYPWNLALAESRGWDRKEHQDALDARDDDAITLTHPTNWLTEDEVESPS